MVPGRPLDRAEGRTQGNATPSGSQNNYEDPTDAHKCQIRKLHSEK